MIRTITCIPCVNQQASTSWWVVTDQGDRCPSVSERAGADLECQAVEFQIPSHLSAARNRSQVRGSLAGEAFHTALAACTLGIW